MTCNSQTWRLFGPNSSQWIHNGSLREALPAHTTETTLPCIMCWFFTLTLFARQWATRIQKWRISNSHQSRKKNRLDCRIWYQVVTLSMSRRHLKKLSINWSWKNPQLPTDPLKRISCGPLRICTLYNRASILVEPAGGNFFEKPHLIYYSQ